MKSIVIAPHPDDEVLGVGGTLLKEKVLKKIIFILDNSDKIKVKHTKKKDLESK